MPEDQQDDAGFDADIQPLSPYAPPQPLELAGDAEIVEPEVAPRLWSVFTVVPASIFASAIISSVIGLLAIFLLDSQVPSSPAAIAEKFEQLFASAIGPWLLMTGSLVFLGSAMLAGYLSPVLLAQRLGLVAPRGSLSLTLLLILLTPVVGMISSLMLSALSSAESENMLLFYNIVKQADSPPRILLLIFVIGVMPGLAEELLFRGYMQQRLLETWSPPLAIGVASLIFAAAHLEPLHVLGVLPLGVWLGLIAYQSKSTWPAVAAHVLNNSLSVIIMLAMGNEQFV